MHGHRIGYVRVSSFEQNPERQLEVVSSFEKDAQPRSLGTSKKETIAEGPDAFSNWFLYGVKACSET